MRYIAVILTFVILASSASAQGYISVSKTSQKASTAGAPPTRDFWFAIPQNYDPKDVNGEIFSFYITSPVNTTISIQIQGQAVVKKPVTANQVLTHIVPRNLEINRSSVIETDKAIHIWSDDADLNVYFMSRNDFTSDGTVVLPSYSYGKEYVVAAATALYVGASVDLPSEFIVIATKDNTALTIIPSQDIRQEGAPTVVLHAKGVPFTEFLKKGECIQYQTTQSQDIPWDLSGTKISSNEPIAVVGASACPFIPADPYCDHVVEMIPPADV
ncbi:MAG TPA: IgGFc-binding protein, partial [Candidatus Kapabacteria bacterium]